MGSEVDVQLTVDHLGCLNAVMEAARAIGLALDTNDPVIPEVGRAGGLVVGAIQSELISQLQAIPGVSDVRLITTRFVPSCDICDRLAAPPPEDEVIVDTPLWRLTLAPEQTYLGRAYLTLQRHAPSLPALTRDERLAYFEVVSHYEKQVAHAFGAALFNWSCLLNNAYQAPVPRPHVHWHVRPRYRTAPLVAGQPYPDLKFGHHYVRDQPQLADPDRLSLIAERLRRAS